ncbi:hypothetical protein BBJ28_00022740 [Nothophytophthora sp. Chile5]|nr:hypothetical protein BBJ28_00022740 [Nothophytophthora sp. Chile5]
MSQKSGAQFIGRKELLEWLNALCGTQLTKVEQTCTGAMACQILDAMYPGRVPMHKVDWTAANDYEFVQNYKLLQKCFTSLQIDQHIPVDRLVRGKYQDSLEFMQWFKTFYDRNTPDQPYDPVAQRKKGKGGARYTGKLGGVPSKGIASPGTPTTARATKRVATPAATASCRLPGSPGRASPQLDGTAIANMVAQYEQKGEELKASNAALKSRHWLDMMRRGSSDVVWCWWQVGSLERDRDFHLNQLQAIENLLEGTEAAETTPLVLSIAQLLYAAEDDFEQKRAVDEFQDEPM